MHTRAHDLNLSSGMLKQMARWTEQVETDRYPAERAVLPGDAGGEVTPFLLPPRLPEAKLLEKCNSIGQPNFPRRTRLGLTLLMTDGTMLPPACLCWRDEHRAPALGDMTTVAKFRV